MYWEMRHFIWHLVVGGVRNADRSFDYTEMPVAKIYGNTVSLKKI